VGTRGATRGKRGEIAVIVHQCLIFVRSDLRSVLPVREKARTGKDEVLVDDYELL